LAVGEKGKEMKNTINKAGRRFYKTPIRRRGATIPQKKAERLVERKEGPSYVLKGGEKAGKSSFPKAKKGKGGIWKESGKLKKKGDEYSRFGDKKGGNKY